MTRTTASILVEIATRAASHPNMERAVLGAVRATLPGVIESVMRELHPGDTLRLYVPKTSSVERQERDRRIGAALEAGEASAAICRRENVSLRHIQRMKKRFRLATG